MDKLRIYTGLLYEYYDREASGASATSTWQPCFYALWCEYPVSNDLL